jgi:hypothetical protein
VDAGEDRERGKVMAYNVGEHIRQACPEDGELPLRQRKPPPDAP